VRYQTSGKVTPYSVGFLTSTHFILAEGYVKELALDENKEIKEAFGEYSLYAYNPIVNAGGINKAKEQGADRAAFTGSPNPLYSAPDYPFAAAVQKVVVEGMSPADAVKEVALEAERVVEEQKKEMGWGK